MSAHVTSPRTYVAVFLALMVLTALTVGAAYVNLNAFNNIVAMAIAFCKAALVAWIFMNLRHGSPLSKLAAVGGLLWLIILFGLTLADYWTRGFLA